MVAFHVCLPLYVVRNSQITYITHMFTGAAYMISNIHDIVQSFFS